MRAWCSALLVSGFTFLAGCTPIRSATRGLESPADMTRAVSAKVPVGASVEDAQRFMEREGFTCSATVNGNWGDCKGMDYLYCDRTEGGLVSRRWQVAVVHANGKVTEVLANTGLIGP